MSILEDYDRRFDLAELTPDEIMKRVELAEACLTSPAVGDPRLHTERVVVWLHDALQSHMQAALNPQRHRCGWCYSAAGATEEAWSAMPSMSLDEVQAHTRVCEHNPLVIELRRMTALLEEHGFIRGEATTTAIAPA